MLDAELIELLVCPETKQSLRSADSDVLTRLNEAIADGRVKNRGGTPVSAPLSTALVREDGRLLYPVREDIPIMLLDESIELDDLG
jgi:uncharacterized protein YbaR (Trm112 family)